MSGRVDSTLTAQSGETRAKPAGKSATGALFTFAKPNVAVRVRLDCFHHAGGGAHLSFVGVPFAGEHRGVRGSTASAQRAYVGRVRSPITARFCRRSSKPPGQPCRMPGHSMGAIVAFGAGRHLSSTRTSATPFISSSAVVAARTSATSDSTSRNCRRMSCARSRFATRARRRASRAHPQTLCAGVGKADAERTGRARGVDFRPARFVSDVHVACGGGAAHADMFFESDQVESN